MDAARIRGMYWYHTIDLPIDGQVVRTPGEYDHARYIDRYGFPASMTGMRVLDIGAADGWFSFEFERRGAAEVVAADRVSGYPDVPYHEVARFGPGIQWTGAHRFHLARELLGSSVMHIDQDIHALDSDVVGTFDLVFCGSLLLHISDPFLALKAWRRVCRGSLIVATAYYRAPVIRLYEAAMSAAAAAARRRTRFHFAALAHNEMDDTYWIPTTGALLDMVERAGFAAPRLYATFELRRTNGRRGWPHAIVHASSRAPS